MRAHAREHAQSYQVAQGSQHVHHHYHGDQTRAVAAAVVEQIADCQKAARSIFVGRHAHVDQLLDLLDPTGPGPATAVVSAVAGLGGVGKTTLARHVAQIAVGRRWFPGGAVWVDMHGYAPDPDDRAVPGQVVSQLLQALGVPAEQVPPQPGEQAAAYHHVLKTLAEVGRPVLLVLDNVSGTDQLKGLLPVLSAHRAVVTSRHTLGDLDGVRIVDLNVLDTGEAVELVDQALRERDPGDRRAVEDSDGMVALAGVCGWLPLALRIAAALLADDPGTTVSDLAGELADTATRLDTLAYEGRAVAAAFDLSWQHLSQRDSNAATLFRLLPLNPGPDIATAAAAALADLPVGRVRPLLRVLRRAHLVELGSTPGRWRMHDLVRAYAIRLDGEGHAEATSRLLAYYTTTADAADDHLRALPGQPVPIRFTDRDQALAWLDAERANLTVSVDLAATTGDHGCTFRLVTALAQYLSWRRHLEDWVIVAGAALHAARHLADHHREAVAWNNLGLALRQVRRFDEAITAHEHAGDLYREVGDRHHEGRAWNNLGLALAGVRRFDEAITAHQTALGIHCETGDRHREGMAWNNLGLALAGVGKFDEAITAHDTALDIFGQVRDRRREGQAWNNVGLPLRKVGRLEEAIIAHQTALDIFGQIRDRHGEGTAWDNLSGALAAVRRFDEAIIAHQTALDIFRQTRDLYGEGSAWNNLGSGLAEVGKLEEAVNALEQAVLAYTEADATEEAVETRRRIQSLKRAGQPQP